MLLTQLLDQRHNLLQFHKRGSTASFNVIVPSIFLTNIKWKSNNRHMTAVLGQ